MADSTNINDKPASESTKLEAKQASQVSSLSSFTMKMQEQTKKDIKSMEDRIDSVMRFQAMSKKRAEYAAKAIDSSTKSNKQLASSTSKILGSMNNTIKQLAVGTQKITTSTAVGSKDMLKQYGKAISEDVNYNKQNMVATALSQSTPIFGYFAAKFMETDVFQGAADRIKLRLGDAVKDAFQVSKGMLRTAKDKVSDIFTRSGKVEYSDESKRYLGDTAIAVKDAKDKITGKFKKPIQKAARGGYVDETGVVKVHKGEVITPIEKLPQIAEAMTRMRRVADTPTGTSVHGLIKVMADNAVSMEDFVGEQQKMNRSLTKSFIAGWKEARSPKKKSFENRMLKATLEMKVAMVGMTSRMKIAWQRVLTEHPLFRNLLGVSEILKTSIFTPIQFLFGMRGGYRKYLPKGLNNFQNISQILNITFVQQMQKLDKIIFYLKTLTEGTVGESGDVLLQRWKEEDKKNQDKWSVASRIRNKLKGGPKEKKSLGELGLAKLTARLGLDKESLDKAGITTLLHILSPKKVLKGMGVSKESTRDYRTQAGQAAEKAKWYAGYGADEARMYGEMGKEKMKDKASEMNRNLKKKADRAKWYAGYGADEAKMYGGMLRDKMPFLADGGLLKRTGPIYAHKGEMVLPADKMNSLIDSFNESAKIFKDTANQKKERAKWRYGYAKDEAKMYGESVKEKAGKVGGLFRNIGRFFGIGLTYEEKLERQQKKHDKEMRKKRKKWHKFDNKFFTAMEKDYQKHLKRSTKIATRIEGFIEKRTTRFTNFKTKLAEKLEKGIEKIKTKGEKNRQRTLDTIAKDGIKKRKKIEEYWDSRALKHQQKRLSKIRKAQDKIFGKHKNIMKYFFNKQHRFEMQQERKRKKIAKQQEKVEKKRNKALNKVKDLKLKIEKNREKWQTKLEAKKKKMEERLETRRAKLEGRVKFLQLKKQMKEDEQKAKIQRIRDKALMKLEQKKAKAEMKVRMKEMKAETAKLKKQMKEEKAKLKAELKQARKDQWEQRKILFKERLDYLKNTPRRLAEFRKQFGKDTKERIELAKQQLYKLNKLEGVLQSTKDALYKGFGFIKKITTGAFKWIMIAGAFLKDIIFGGFKTFIVPAMATAFGAVVGGAKSVIATIAGKAALQAGGMGAGAAGIAGVGVGGYMAVKDAMAARKNAKEWGTSKLGATLGGALGGTEAGGKGAKRGALKGAALGAGIGSFIPGVGTLVGGAVGAIAGGLMGALGGKNIAKGMDFIAQSIKKLVKGVYNFVTFPVRFAWKVIKTTISDFKEAYKKKGGIGLITEMAKKTLKLALFPIYLPIKIMTSLSEKIRDLAKGAGKKAWDKIKFEVMMPFKWVGSLFTNLFSTIKEFLVDKLRGIPFVGEKIAKWADGMSSTPTEAADKVNVEASAATKTKPWTSYDAYQSKMSGVPQAAVGGLVTKTGLVKVHAGELISPISDEIKERIENAVTSGSDIAKKDAISDTAKTKFLIQEQAKAQKEAMDDFAKTNSLTTATVINNITNSMSSSMQSIANNMGNQDRGHFDPLAKQILEGDIN